VVIDGGSDNTAAAAQAADDGSGRLRLILLEVNRGPAAARNVALETAKGDLVCVLDADDYITDGRFARMLARADEDWDFLADDILIADESAPEDVYGKLLGLPDGATEPLRAVDFIRANITTPSRPRQELGYLKPLMRASFLKSAALTYDERLRLGEDYELYARALLHGARFQLISSCGYIAVQYTQSLSRRHETADLAALADADLRLIELAGRLHPQAVQMLQAHRRNVLQKLDYRTMLDAKWRSDWRQVFASLFRTPATTAFILDATLRKRWEARRPATTARP
jgi:succinoglycan biosynthesis protein ExoU